MMQRDCAVWPGCSRVTDRMTTGISHRS